MILSKEERKIIKKELPYGTQTKIARELGVSYSAISQYLNGKRNSSNIELRILEEYKAVKCIKQEMRNLIYG